MSSSRKGWKSNLEVALKSIMTGFASSNEAIEQKQITIEEMKINADMKRLNLEGLGWNLRNARRRRRDSISIT